MKTCLDTAWNVDNYKVPGEDDFRWQRRRSFMTAHKGEIAELQLVFMAQLFNNIEFMCCKYPDEMMHQLGILPQAELAKEFRKTLSKKLKRKFDQQHEQKSTKPKVKDRKKKIVAVKIPVKTAAQIKAKHMARKQKARVALGRLCANNNSADLRSKLRGNHPQQTQRGCGAEIPPPIEFAGVEEVDDTPTPAKEQNYQPPRRHSPIIFDNCDDSKNDSMEATTLATPPVSKRSKYCAGIVEKRISSNRQQNNACSSKTPLLTTPSTSIYRESAALLHSAQYYGNPSFVEHLPPHHPYCEPTMAVDVYNNVSDDYHHQQDLNLNSYNNYDYLPAISNNEMMAAAYNEPNSGVPNFTTETQHFRSIIILDWCNPEKLRRSTEILSVTAQQHHTALSFSYSKTDGFFFCSVDFGGLLSVTSAQATPTKDQARMMACNMLLSQLQQQFYTIQTKPDSAPYNAPTIHIDQDFIDAQRERVNDNSRLTAENKGFQIMKQLGWGGGALGTSGTGIEEPIQVQLRAKRHGLGMAPASAYAAHAPEHHFEFFENYLAGYVANCHNVSKIAVHMPYQNKEWRRLARIASKCGLRCDYVQQGAHQTQPKQCMLIEKVITPAEIADNICQGGVYANFYNLWPPTGTHHQTDF